MAVANAEFYCDSDSDNMGGSGNRNVLIDRHNNFSADKVNEKRALEELKKATRMNNRRPEQMMG